MKTLITGATGLTGIFFLKKLANTNETSSDSLFCLTRSTSDLSEIDKLNLNLTYYTGDSSSPETWDRLLDKNIFDVIIHLVQLRQIPTILNSLQKVRQTPRLIIIGTTGVFSKYNQYSSEYIEAEKSLKKYQGNFCLLRPTMIFGSPKDKNIHKLIDFCNKYRFFPIFGSGNNLLQPIHAEDIAQTLLTVFQSPQIHGAYNISGANVITLKELLDLIAILLDKPIYQLKLPIGIGLALANILEKGLGKKSPIKVEQILRLQEDKAYSHDEASRELNFSPRELKTGLQQEIQLMRMQGML